jgi:hypothetical protein
VARGWCHPKNSAKRLDVNLASAIVAEVEILADAQAKRIVALSADVDAFAAALVCRRNCKTCGGVGRVTGSTITYETDTEEERRDAWLMGSRRCPDCGQKPEAILAAHDAVKDKRIAELEAALVTSLGRWPVTLRRGSWEILYGCEWDVCRSTLIATPQGQAALDAARKVQP